MKTNLLANRPVVQVQEKRPSASTLTENSEEVEVRKGNEPVSSKTDTEVDDKPQAINEDDSAQLQDNSNIRWEESAADSSIATGQC